MNRTRTVALCVAATLVTSTLAAQDFRRVVEILRQDPPSTKDASDAGDAKEAAKKAAAKKAPVPIFELRDKSRVRGRPNLEALAVETRYGVLRVPFDQLVRVRFGLRVDAELSARANTLVKQLGNEDFDVREAAMDRLREIGVPALEPLRAGSRSSDEELANRATILVSEIEEEVTEDAGEDSPSEIRSLLGSDDEVTTDRMVFRGLVQVEQFDIDSRYGRLSIALGDLAQVNFKPSGPTARTLEVQAVQQPPGNWLDTKLDVVKGQLLRLEATGQTSVPDWGISSGPGGNSQYSGNTFGGFPNLSLVGKVGSKGKPFLVGASLRQKSKQQGRLYLAIVPFQYDPGQTSGSYKVKVNLGASK